VVPSSSATAFGTTRTDGPLGAAIPIASALGDQQAALFGQCCFAPGEAKCTYGTGCFLLLHTGPEPVPSRHGLLTTIAGQFGEEPVQYALEGSVAIAGALVQWLRDNLGLIASSAELEPLARQVPDSAGLYFVPAFSGLFAPHWRSDARGVLVGLTHYTTRAHLARAVLDATAYQTRDLLAAMHADTGLQLAELKVDGGMTRNALLMQFQADLLGLPVVRPRQTETTALGAAFAAGLATGFWTDRDELRHTWEADSRWTPLLATADRDRLVAGWQRALERSFDLA
jgi:glycerol kinase